MRKQINVPIIYGYFRGHTFIINSGATFDLSRDGMSFYTDRPFFSGKYLQFQSSYLWRKPKVGSVRWCSMKTKSGYYSDKFSRKKFTLNPLIACIATTLKETLSNNILL